MILNLNTFSLVYKTIHKLDTYKIILLIIVPPTPEFFIMYTIGYDEVYGIANSTSRYNQGRSQTNYC